MRRLFLLAILACALSVVPSAGAISGWRSGCAGGAPRGVPADLPRQPNWHRRLHLADEGGHRGALLPARLDGRGLPVLQRPRRRPAGDGEVVPQPPDFCKPPACTGDPSDPAFFVTDDVAVVELSQPVALSRYAELPKIEKSQGKGKVQKHVGKDVSLLGYGVRGVRAVPGQRLHAHDRAGAALAADPRRGRQVRPDRPAGRRLLPRRLRRAGAREEEGRRPRDQLVELRRRDVPRPGARLPPRLRGGAGFIQSVG